MARIKRISFFVMIFLLILVGMVYAQEQEVQKESLKGLKGVMKMNVITIILAFWGAILSSVLLGWNFYRDITERGKLGVHCYIGNIIIPGSPTDDTEYLVYSVTNIGRKPIYLDFLGGSSSKDKDFLINPRTLLPKKLDAGEHFMEYTPDLSVLDDDLLFLCVRDTLGKVYKVKKSVVKDLIKKRKEKRETKII